MKKPEEEIEEVHHVTSQDELEKELKLIRSLVEQTECENQAYAAYRIMMEALIWGARSMFEAEGMLKGLWREYHAVCCRSYSQDEEEDEEESDA